MKKLKENKIIKRIFEYFKIVLTTISPTLCSKFLYFLIFHERLNLKNPKNFNEKLMWLKLNTYKNNDLVTICADKYLVRNYIEEKGCGEILNDLLYVYDNSSEINWDVLPEKFALKCNHGCGCNIICNSKKNLNEESVKLQLKKWMNTDFWKSNAEINYKNINKKIICEKYIENKSSKNALPIDYKIYCFNGKAEVILVCSEREKKLKLSFYDTEWNKLDIGKTTVSTNSKKPENLTKMLKYAKVLSKDFPFVRVDFYEVDDKIIFGEMTFTPAGCLATYYNKYGLEYLGNLLDIRGIKK